MVLNVIWIGFFLIAFVVAGVKLVFFQDTEVFTAMVARWRYRCASIMPTGFPFR